jgi:hypothetical protein
VLALLLNQPVIFVYKSKIVSPHTVLHELLSLSASSGDQDGSNEQRMINRVGVKTLNVKPLKRSLNALASELIGASPACAQPPRSIITLLS